MIHLLINVMYLMHVLIPNVYLLKFIHLIIHLYLIDIILNLFNLFHIIIHMN